MHAACSVPSAAWLRGSTIMNWQLDIAAVEVQSFQVCKRSQGSVTLWWSGARRGSFNYPARAEPVERVIARHGKQQSHKNSSSGPIPGPVGQVSLSLSLFCQELSCPPRRWRWWACTCAATTTWRSWCRKAGGPRRSTTSARPSSSSTASATPAGHASSFLASSLWSILSVPSPSHQPPLHTRIFPIDSTSSAVCCALCARRCIWCCVRTTRIGCSPSGRASCGRARSSCTGAARARWTWVCSRCSTTRSSRPDRTAGGPPTCARPPSATASSSQPTPARTRTWTSPHNSRMRL